jgi:hypothetical protein
MNVYQAIGAVSAALTKQGIGKGRKNTQQGYNFRGIDDVLNALSSALVDAGLVILPRVVERVIVERETQKGGAIFNVTIKVDFDLVSTEDGSKHTVSTYGEAMDSADKATNKAMSAAYKYLALLVFCIPTEATPETDADFTTHEVKAKKSGVMADVLKDLPALSKDESLWYDELAANVQDLFDTNGIKVAFDRIESEQLEHGQVLQLWSRLGSKVRSALKVEKGLRIGAALNAIKEQTRHDEGRAHARDAA